MINVLLLLLSGMGYVLLTLYFIIPRTGSTQLTENRTTLDLSFLISPDVSTNSIVKVFIKEVPLLAILTKNISSNFLLSICQYVSTSPENNLRVTDL